MQVYFPHDPFLRCDPRRWQCTAHGGCDMWITWSAVHRETKKVTYNCMCAECFSIHGLDTPSYPITTTLEVWLEIVKYSSENRDN